MPAQPSLSSTINKLLVFSLTVATFTILSASSAKAYTTWTILIDVSQGVDPPIYSFTYSPKNPAPNCPGLPQMSAQKAENLHICPGDKIEWDIRAHGSQKTLTIHQNQGFQPHGSDIWFRPGALSLANVVSDPHDIGTTYEYCVAAYDDQGYNFQLYSHDPKIIIGGTNLGPAIENLLTASHQLVKKIDGDVDLSEKAKEKVRKRAAKIDKQIRDLRELLK